MTGWLIVAGALALLLAALAVWKIQISIRVQDSAVIQARMWALGCIPALQTDLHLRAPWPHRDPEEEPAFVLVIQMRLWGTVKYLDLVARCGQLHPLCMRVSGRVLWWRPDCTAEFQNKQLFINGKPLVFPKSIISLRNILTKVNAAQHLKNSSVLLGLELSAGGSPLADRAAILKGLINGVNGIACARHKPWEVHWQQGVPDFFMFRIKILLNLFKLVTLRPEKTLKAGEKNGSASH